MLHRRKSREFHPGPGIKESFSEQGGTWTQGPPSARKSRVPCTFSVIASLLPRLAERSRNLIPNEKKKKKVLSIYYPLFSVSFSLTLFLKGACGVNQPTCAVPMWFCCNHMPCDIMVGFFKPAWFRFLLCGKFLVCNKGLSVKFVFAMQFERYICPTISWKEIIEL